MASYEHGRPGYPERVYELLVERCGLVPGTQVLEVGPGTGQATGRLLDLGASVAAVELGTELGRHLMDKFSGRDLTVAVDSFEEVELRPASVDLVVAATAFHWVPTDVGLQKCADVLRTGGWLALWWSHFGDPDRADPFHDALVPMLERLAPMLLDVPSAATSSADDPPYALDSVARIAEIDASGRFGSVLHEVVAWTGRHTAEQLRSMFASFSPWLALEPGHRSVVLDALERLARDEFGGVVDRPYLTPVYLAPRLP